DCPPRCRSGGRSRYPRTARRRPLVGRPPSPEPPPDRCASGQSTPAAPGDDDSIDPDDAAGSRSGSDREPERGGVETALRVGPLDADLDLSRAPRPERDGRAVPAGLGLLLGRDVERAQTRLCDHQLGLLGQWLEAADAERDGLAGAHRGDAGIELEGADPERLLIAVRPLWRGDRDHTPVDAVGHVLARVVLPGPLPAQLSRGSILLIELLTHGVACRVHDLPRD